MAELFEIAEYRNPRRASAPPSPVAEAEILIFTGIRYERMDDAPCAAAPREDAAVAKLSPLPVPICRKA